MRKKIYKILGVALTLTLLASLVVGFAAAPASANTLEWSKKNLPKAGEDGDWFRGADYDDIDSLGPIVKAIDGTLYVAGDIDGDYHVFKSTDDGREWKMTEYEDDAEGGLVYAMVASSMDADILYVADDNQEVHKTKDGGKKWTTLPGLPLDGSERITAIDVGYIDDDPYVFASTSTDGGTGGDVYVLQEAVFSAEWDPMLIDTDRTPAWGAGADVWDVAVSRMFDSDQTIIAVATDINDGETYCTLKYGGSKWGSTIDDAALDPDGGDADAVDEVYAASIWLPADFDSDEDSGDMEYFVGIASFDPYEGDVYRIVTDDAFDRDINGSNSAVNVTGLDGVGDVGGAYLVAVGNNPDDDEAKTVCYYSDSNGGSWDESLDDPSGSADFIGHALLSVVLMDDYADSGEAIAASVGDQSSVSMTNNYGKSWDDISLISTNIDYLKDIQFVGDAHFIIAEADDGEDDLWRYDGDNWVRAYHRSTIDELQATPDGDRVFIADFLARQIRWGKDGDSRFSSQLGKPDDTITAWVVIDKDTIITGADALVWRTTNNGTTWRDYDDGLADCGEVMTFALSPTFDDDETILLGDDGGQVFKSTDGGESWSEITKGGFGGSGGDDVYVAFDPGYDDNGAYYAAGTDGDGDLVIDRYNGEWQTIFPNDNFAAPEADGYATGLIAVPGSDDVTLYATHDDLDGMFRCLNPLVDVEGEETDEQDDVEWEQVDKGISVALEALRLTSGSNVLWGYEDDDRYHYEDTLAVPVSLSAPGDGSSSDRVDSATLKWTDLSGADMYEVDVNEDPSFDGTDWSPDDASSLTSILVSGLDDGQTYYWRVRVAEDEPVLSRWSETRSFTTAMGAAQWNPFVGGVPESPYNGATNVPLQPSFAWNAADWATGYEFVLAKDTGYSDTVASKTGANALTTTVYLSEQKLDYETTYYWKVRAISKSTQSEWASAVFTTIGKPAPTPTPPTTPPAPEPPGTPAYIWVIIGIGAALVIVVIILIVRTRRVA
jgi:photosystem II stability/assembly factor-like uncharacterized protein